MKKVVATLLSATMCAGLLVGCGGGAAPAEKKAEAAPAAKEEAAAEVKEEAAAGSGVGAYVTADYDFEAAAEDMVKGVEKALGDAAAVKANTGAKASPIGAAMGSDPTKITISWWGGDSRHAAYQEALAAFEAKYPNVSVKDNTHYAAWSGWEELMSTALYAGNAEDICQVNWNWLSNYSGDGSKFVDLNEYSDIIDLSQFPEAALAACTVADKLQCIPVSMTGRIFYWNMDTFKAAGLDSYPKTYEDMINAGKTFEEKLGKDYYPLVLGEYDRMLLMTFWLESTYGKQWVVDNELQYNAEEIAEGMKFIQSLEDNHVIPSIPDMNAAGIDGSNSIDKSEKWINGVYAGIFEWDSSASKFQGALPEDKKGEFTVGDEIKFGDKANGGFAKVSLGLAITESCKDKAAAATIINYLLNDEEGAGIMGTQCGMITSKAGQAAAEKAGAINKLVKEANDKVLGFVDFQLDPIYESSDLKNNPGGVYSDVLGGLSYGEY